MTEFRLDRIVQLDPLPGANILWFDPNIDEGYLLIHTDDPDALDMLKLVRDNQKTLLPDGMMIEIYPDDLPNATATSRLIELAIEDYLASEMRRSELERAIGAQATSLLVPLLCPSGPDRISAYREAMYPPNRKVPELSLAYKLDDEQSEDILKSLVSQTYPQPME